MLWNQTDPAVNASESVLCAQTWRKSLPVSESQICHFKNRNKVTAIPQSGSEY